MQICFLQLPSVAGQPQANAQQILTSIRSLADHQSIDQSTVLYLTPELYIANYASEDLLLQSWYCEQIRLANQLIVDNLPANCNLALGTLSVCQLHHYNSLWLISGGKLVCEHRKFSLPTYGVFDDTRYFSPGEIKISSVQLADQKVGMLICSDLWRLMLGNQYHKKMAQMLDDEEFCKTAADTLAQSIADNNLVCDFDRLLLANASPFEIGKHRVRLSLLQQAAQVFSAEIAYCNQVGAQDEIVFDGASFKIDKQGKISQAPAFSAYCGQLSSTQPNYIYPDTNQSIYQALIVSMKSFFEFNQCQHAVVGLSGGIDSALVAYLASQALGAQNLTLIWLPSEFSSLQSERLAKQQAEIIGCPLLHLPITDINKLIVQLWPGELNNLAAQNLQARIRCLLLMAYCNNQDKLHFLLATCNKSELLCGFSTIYGDLAGAFAPLKDVSKLQVWQLANWINTNAAQEQIVQEIIEREPTAELSAGQKDTDSIPEYQFIDQFMRQWLYDLPELIVDNNSASCEPADLLHLQKTLYKQQYKRQQSPIGPKISVSAFGRDWRMPVASRYSFPLNKPSIEDK